MMIDTILPKTVIKWHLSDCEGLVIDSRGKTLCWEAPGNSGTPGAASWGSIKISLLFIESTCKKQGKKQEITGKNVSFRVSSFCSWSLLAWPGEAISWTMILVITCYPQHMKCETPMKIQSCSPQNSSEFNEILSPKLLSALPLVSFTVKTRGGCLSTCAAGRVSHRLQG